MPLVTEATTPAVIVQGSIRPTRLLLSANRIQERVAELARTIEQATEAKDEIVVLICLDGAMIFAADLIRQLARTTRLETVKLKSYVGTESTGTVVAKTVLPSDLTDKHVLIVEDIVDTGNTLNHLLALVKEQNPLSVRTVALLDKPSARRLPVFADYVGFEIGPQFVVGYGLDVDGRYRNLPYVAEVVLD